MSSSRSGTLVTRTGVPLPFNSCPSLPRNLRPTLRVPKMLVACQNSSKAPDLGFYPRRSCSFVSSICSWSGCSTVCLPKILSAQVGVAIWFRRGPDELVARRRSARCSMMDGCAAATGLPGCDERVRVTAASSRERPVGCQTALAASDLRLPEAAGGSTGREAGLRSMGGTR